MQEKKEQDIFKQVRDYIDKNFSLEMKQNLLKNRIPLSFTQINQSNKFLIIRHAIGQKNVASAQYKTNLDPNKKHWREQVWGENKLIDGPVHQLGMLQADVLQKHLKQFKIRTVFVSPLKRAIMTMKTLFIDHPCSKDINIIVEPLLRESLDLPNDIPSLPLSYFQKLKQQLADKGLNLNLSKLINSSQANAAAIDTFFSDEGKKDREQFLDIISSEKLQGDQITAKYIDFILKKSLAKEEYRYEDFINLNNRAKLFKQKLLQHSQQIKLQQDEKIIVITHCSLIKRLTAEKFEQSTHYPINFKRMKNGQICSLDI